MSPKNMIGYFPDTPVSIEPSSSSSARSGVGSFGSRPPILIVPQLLLKKGATSIAKPMMMKMNATFRSCPTDRR